MLLVWLLVVLVVLPLCFGTLKAVWIALDQCLNALLGGWPDETLSSRCWRWEVSGQRAWPRQCIDVVALCLSAGQDRNHCLQSYENERLGRQSPPEFRRQP